MKNGYTRAQLRRLASLLLAVVVAVTFMPFLDDGSYAASENTKKSIKNAKEKLRYIDEETGEEIDPALISGPEDVLNDFSVDDISIGTEPTGGILTAEPLEDESAQESSEPQTEDFVNLINDKEELAKIFPEGFPSDKLEVTENEEVEGDENEEASQLNAAGSESLSDLSDESDATEEDSKTVLLEKSLNEGLDTSGAVSTEGINTAYHCTLVVAPDYSNATVVVGGYIEEGYTGSYKIKNWELYNNNNKCIADIPVNNTGFLYSVNMRGFSTGYYYIRAHVLKNGSYAGYVSENNIYFDYVSVTPDTSGSYEAYSTYFNYQKWDPRYVQGYRLYIDYWAPGGAVTTKYMENYYTTYQFSGLAPNTVYNIRFRYGMPAHGTVMFGPYSGTTAIRTGIAKLPKIKSIKVKAYKVKKRRAGVYGWYTGYYFGSVKYYTYKIKVTVEFKTKKKKKKPGLNGLYINGVWKGGNKKKYTLKLGPYANYSKPRGKKFNVYVCTAHSPGGYKGYSPMVSKRKNVK